METNPNYQRDVSPELIFEGDLAHASLEQSLVEAMKIITRCRSMMVKPLFDAKCKARAMRGKEHDKCREDARRTMLDANSASRSMETALRHLDSALYHLYRRQAIPFFYGNLYCPMGDRAAAPLVRRGLEWRPIDTYFDGKVSHKFVALCGIDFTCVGLWDSDSSHRWVDSFGEPCEPTHWIPLPDNPFMEGDDVRP